MWQRNHLVIFTLSIFLGIVCGELKNSVRSGTRTITRKSELRPEGSNDYEKNLGILIESIRALSTDNDNAQSNARSGILDPHQPHGSRTGAGESATREGTNFNTYFNIFNGVYSIYEPLLRHKFLENLPRTVVCILSDRADCGLQAELTKTVSTALRGTLLSLIGSVRTQTCPLLPATSRSSGPTQLLKSYLRMADSTVAEVNGFQEMLQTALLSDLPVYFSDNLVSTWSSFMDMTVPPIVSYISDFMVTVLQTPIDFVKMGLQFGIDLPALDQSEECQQGDLRQLLMWGMSHNVSWSFGESILDMFLAPEPPPCSYPGPGCQVQTVQFSRVHRSAADHLDAPLSCDQKNLARLNDTLCAELLAAGPQGGSATLYAFCQALSDLAPAQIERVWRNSCHMIQSVLSPFLDGSACSGGAASPPEGGSRRVSRSTLSLNELLCNYDNWTSAAGGVAPALVTLCSDNDREAFLRGVCGNSRVMRMLDADPQSAWVWNYCSNSSDGAMVSQYCAYDAWAAQMADASMVVFCWHHDRDRLQRLLCDSLDFFMLVYSQPENNWLQLNCSKPPVQVDIAVLVAEYCRYAEWREPAQVTLDLVSMCIQHDEQSFVREVCANATFLVELLLNDANMWVGDYCAFSVDHPPTGPPTSPPTSPPTPPPTGPRTEPPVIFSILDWCNYGMWAEVAVDPSVVGLCWQHDQLGFQKNVCCHMPLFQKLTLEPQNEWLLSMCPDRETADTSHLAQVCLYSDWSRPTIVDMTDLALCAELDPHNFTQKVCANATVLRNLLANLDNTWLLEHCANLTGGAGGEGGLMGFQPAEQCQYGGWVTGHPDTALLALCWYYDQANFVASVCTDSTVLARLALEPSSVWVGTLCATFTDDGAGSHGNRNGSATTATTEPPPARTCVVRDLVHRLNWSCSADLGAACGPGSGQAGALQLLLRCGLETLQPRVESLLTARVASAVGQAASVGVVLLVALEESQMTSLRVTENIRLSVLESVVLYLERETNFDNKRVLLQCFGKLLTSLMLTGRDVTSNGFFLIKEYFRIPLASLRAVLKAVDITTIRQILQYFNRNQDTLQLSDEYLRTMVSVLFHTHLARDGSLFPDLTPLLAQATPTDIHSLPPLQSNAIVVNTINSNMAALSLEQRRAFGRWFGRSVGALNVTAGGPSFIRDTGNLIVYLPFHSFQHLSPAQLLAGLEVVLRNTLSPLQQQFVAQSVIGVFRNLTADQFRRLGDLSCLANPADLVAYSGTEAFHVIQDNIRACVSRGHRVASDIISRLFLNTSDLQSPATLSSQRVSQLAHFLPLLGADFLHQLSQSQLIPALPSLALVPFTPMQASVIVDSVSTSASLTLPGQLVELGSLVSGVRVETLWSLPSDTLLSALPDIALHSSGLSPLQANAITTKLWGSLQVSEWLDEVEPLLSSTPLLSVLPRTSRLLANSTYAQTRTWNTQQAKALYKEAMKTMPSPSIEEFLSLGTIAQGVSCNILRRLFLDHPSLTSMRTILTFLREQPVPLHTSLKKCVIEELYHFDFFSELLEELGCQITLSLPMSTIKKFPADMMDSLRKMIVLEPHHFLLLPSIKQALLVDKMIQRLNMYTGEYTEEEFRSLGVMATFVVDEVFVQLERSFFMESLELLKGLCYNSSKRDLVARILQEPSTFGSVQNWTPETLNQVDRFLFFLPKETIQQIPAGLMTQERIERLFLSQQRWEAGPLGSLCTQGRDHVLFEKQQFVLQYFLGFLRVGRTTPAGLIPSCENLHMTQPAAWSVDSLVAMPTAAFRSCLELIGQDPFLSPYKLLLLLGRVKQVYGPASSLSPLVVAQLGRMATQLSMAELAGLALSEIRTISALGTISSWNRRQLSVLFSTVLNSTRQIPSQLDSSTLVALGYIVCGIDATVMRNLNAVEFSKAVLWLGHLRLECSEAQQQALVGLLSHSLAFGHISTWGQAVFIEIGALAAGIPDMAMSALVREQIEGMTPLAVSTIPAEKFAVVFNQAQIRMFSYEQAIAVTEAQRLALTPVQLTALAMVLNPWEDRPVDFRGRSVGVAPRPAPLCHLLGLLLLSVLLSSTLSA